MPPHLISEQTRGVFVISATPFDDAGGLDLESTDRLVDFYLGHGVDGLTILGMMGEAPKLSPEDSATFAERVLARVGGRVPVVVGVSSPGLALLENLSKAVMDQGAAGVMIAPPPTAKTEVPVLGYFEQVVGALGADIPICLQDYPTSTGVDISVATFHRLVAAHASLVMLKHEDFPGLRKLTAVRRAEQTGSHRRVSIMVANAGLYYPLEMRRGADGIMTGFAYPEMLVDVFKLFDEGHAEAAEDLFDLYLPILRYEYQIGMGLAVRKEILRRRGAITSARTRAPGPALDADDLAELTNLMKRLDAKLARHG